MSPSIDDPVEFAPAHAHAVAPESNESTAGAAGSLCSPPAPVSSGKTVHSLVLDTGALIRNEPTVSTLLAQASELYTIPAVLSEIRDPETRNRVDNTLRPFLTLRSPKPESIRFVTSFARKTGDLEVLSSPDIHLLALTYELECERNGGDWRLRNNPTQKHLNGKPPGANENKRTEGGEGTEDAGQERQDSASPVVPTESQGAEQANIASSPDDPSPCSEVEQKLDEPDLEDAPTEDRAPALADEVPQAGETTLEAVPAEEGGSDSDSDGWITPSNLKKHMGRDGVASAPSTRSTQRFLQAALITTDYAMQNVALRINLNLISSALCRITRLKSFVLRCHGCFAVTKDMTKQFCPKCGQPTLIRTSCSTDDKGVFQLHLKKNFQWNNRGNVYSIPKPVHGTASGKASKVAGGGKNGWGQKLIFAEDQKEYLKAKNERQKARQRDLMDEDYLPGILTGERSSAGDRIRVGAGRSVNSRKPRR